jgi:hypothetical protein
LKGDIGLSIDIFIPCLLEAHSIQSFHDDPIYPNYSAQINGVINPNLKAGKLYVDVPMFDNTTNCVYQGTLSLNIEAISNPNNLGVTDKTYINERNKIIYHGIIRESQAKATGQLTLKTLSCYPGGEISNPLDNYIPFPSTSANLREIKYSEITITKK